MSSPDPLAFARDLLLELVPGTALATVPIRADCLEEGDEPPVILLRDAGALRHRGLPAFHPARVDVVCYGETPEQAASLFRGVSDLLHRAGPLKRDGVALWKAYDETGPSPSVDPDTRWPLAFGVVALHLADEAFA